MDINATVPGGLSPEYAFKLWNLVIRPPRATYDLSQLGPTEFIVGGVRGARRDVRLKTARGLWLQCSHFVPRQVSREPHKCPVIIYLHGNSSSRLEASNLVGTLISQHISLFCFDAAGCGLSEGEYISLGWHEREDLVAVIDHLRASPLVGPIGLWGRSMGAATAMMYADRDPAIGALCLDSPFASLKQLAEELAASDRLVLPIPSWLVSWVLALIRMRVKALADFDIEDINPIDHARRSHIPAMFLHARRDNFVRPSHSQQLYEAYAGDKEMVTVEGDHNSERSEQVINHAISFFRRAFRLDELDLSVPAADLDRNLQIPKHDGQTLRLPPSRPHPVALRPPPTMAKPQGSDYARSLGRYGGS